MIVLKKYGIGLLTFLLLTSCTGNTQTMNNKAKDTPAVNAMVKGFNKQEHRLELNGCEMKYNDKSFHLGMTIEELIKVFGEYKSSDRGIYVWEDIGIVVIGKDENNSQKNISEYLYIYMNTEVTNKYKDKLNYILNHKQDYFLFNGIPINKDIRMHEIIENSKYDFSDFEIGRASYTINFKECDDTPIEYYFSSDIPWVYKGGGHLMTKSHIDYENTYHIEFLQVHFKK